MRSLRLFLPLLAACGIIASDELSESASLVRIHPAGFMCLITTEPCINREPFPNLRKRMDSMNWTGLWTGLILLLAIGMGFFWVIKIEYALGAGVWPVILAFGLLVSAASLFMPSFSAAVVLGLLGGTMIWGATELPAQAKRVERGIFPSNPKRTARRKSRR